MRHTAIIILFLLINAKPSGRSYFKGNMHSLIVNTVIAYYFFSASLLSVSVFATRSLFESYRQCNKKKKAQSQWVREKKREKKNELSASWSGAHMALVSVSLFCCCRFFFLAFAIAIAHPLTHTLSEFSFIQREKSLKCSLCNVLKKRVCILLLLLHIFLFCCTPE